MRNNDFNKGFDFGFNLGISGKDVRGSIKGCPHNVKDFEIYCVGVLRGWEEARRPQRKAG